MKIKGLTIRLDDNLLNEFNQLVEKNSVNKSALIRSWIENYIKENKEEQKMRTWNREGYEVVEVELDGDLKEFEVVKNGEVIATITPETIEDMEQIITDLDNGEGVDGWEDGMGNTISI